VALNRRGSVAVYQATLGEYPVRTPVRVRLYQRKNRLQRHHVEAFAGYLDRFAIPAGILVTTGGVAPEAALLAATSERPRLALYSGEEWAADLADRGVGLRRRSLRQWIVDLQRALPPRLQRVSRRDHDA
jgi:hypothetical protein